jgi:adenylyl-sulfate kinase
MTDSHRHLRRHDGAISRSERERLLGQRGTVVWFTGLSGSGKSTVARALEERLVRAGRLVYVLDGDIVRQGLCSDLGFSAADRSENIRRVGHVAALLADAGVIVLAAFLSPFRADRARARTVVGDDFFEVFVDAPLAVCEQRDPKGFYAEARAGRIAEFTGVSSPYEAPERPDVHLRTDGSTPQALVDTLVDFLAARGRLSPGSAR